MDVILWLLLPIPLGIKTGTFIFMVAYFLILLSNKLGHQKLDRTVHVFSFILLMYLTFFHDSQLSEELRRVTLFVAAYIIGAISIYFLGFKLVWNDIHTDKSEPIRIKPRDVLLTIVSIYLAYQCVSSLINVRHFISADISTYWIVRIIISSIITGISSIGIWLNKKWGALTYIFLMIIGLLTSALMGSINISLLLVPFLILILLIPKMKFMR